MLNIWASQQQGGSPAPLPEALVVSDFQNQAYSIGGVAKTFADLWDSSAIGRLTETPGVGLVAECAPGTTSGSGTLVATVGVFTAVNPILGATGVISVEIVDTAPGEPQTGMRLSLGQGAPTFYSYNAAFDSNPNFPGAYADEISLYDNTGVIGDSLVVLDNPSRTIPYRFAFTLKPGLFAISYNGSAVVTEVPAIDFFATVAGIRLPLYTYGEAANLIVRSVTLYPLVTDPAILRRLAY